MSFFDRLQKPGSSTIKPKPLQIRREVVVTKPRASPQNAASPRSLGLQPSPTPVPKKRDRNETQPTRIKARSARKREIPEQILKSSSDESGSDESISTTPKRFKSHVEEEVDSKRQVRSKKAFSGEGNGDLPRVHAADIMSLNTSVKYIPAFEGLEDGTEVAVQYPSCLQRERYLLVKPQHGDDDFNPLEEIIEVMRQIAGNYLPPTQQQLFNHETTGYPQRLSRAIKRKSEKEVRRVIWEWNKTLVELRENGTISEILDEARSLDSKLVEQILTQTYVRTVSPQVDLLREYENGTDNVYGELLPKFVSDILKKDTRLTSDQVFVDLGSGVGNVVLQAALEIGCESWGCEMMKNACDLADLQLKEFQTRCRLWGLAVGIVYLERGNFLANSAISQVLKKADVVLVNNQAFTPELNEGLTSLFLDLKEGCRIISLKSFVPAGHKITTRNLNSPINVLEVEEKYYYSGCVSWTNAHGTYYLSTKDTRKIREFINRNP